MGCNFAAHGARLRTMNWDDLRIILAVHDSGTFAGASARLRINETTVARRLARVQRSLGVTLFDAVDGVRKPTAHCEAILARVLGIERQIAEIVSAGNTHPGVAGRFRIASTNSIAEEILAPRAADFLTRNPGITLLFMTSNENVNLSSGKRISPSGCASRREANSRSPNWRRSGFTCSSRQTRMTETPTISCAPILPISI